MYSNLMVTRCKLRLNDANSLPDCSLNYEIKHIENVDEGHCIIRNISVHFSDLAFA